MIRVALIGYGYAGRTFHAPLIRATPGLELTLISTSDPARVRADLHDVRTVPFPAAAMASPDIDLVVIATPNQTHARLVSDSLDAGKHVVVDKPFTVTLEDARRLAARAGTTKRLLAVFHNRRWDADFLAVSDVVSKHVLGDVAHFESHFDRYRPQVRARWREEPGPGSGIWFDLGPHLVDQALLLFGLPDRVTANLASQRPDAQTDDWAHVVMEYGSRRVLLHASMLVAARLPRFIVHGPKGSWVKYGLDVQERQLVAGFSPGDEGWGEDPEPALLFDESGTSTEMRVPRGDYRQFYVQVRDAVERRGPNPVPPAEAVATTAVLETAIQSSREGRALPVPLTETERRAVQNA